MASWGLPCNDASRVTIRLFGADATWHIRGVGQVKLAELAALRTKYGQFLARRRAEGHLGDVQTYACRPIRGASATTYSLHSWPRAVDVRPSDNPMRDDGVLITDFTRFGLLDGVRFVSAFLWAGFDWGTTWDDTDNLDGPEGVRLVRRHLLRRGQRVRDGRVDPMHFELDEEPWSDERVLRALRRFRLRHPIYMQQVLREAGARNLRELMQRWYTRRA